MISFDIFFYTYIFVLVLIPFSLRIFLFFVSLLKKQHKSEEFIDFPHVTILIPAYNEANIITGTLLSALSLDYPNYSVLIVDDCSSDNTFKKVIELKEKYNNKLDIIQNSIRIGKSSIMNHFIPIIDSDYILVLDANIFLYRNSLSKIVKKMSEDTGIVYGNLIFDKNNYSSITDREINYWNIETSSKILQERYLNITSPVGGFYLLKKECFVRIPEKCQIEDMWLLIEILKQNKKSSFAQNAEGHELTVKSSFSEFKRKRRILAGAYFVIFNQVFCFSIFKLKTNDLLCLIFGKILRWIFPILYLILTLICMLNFNNLNSKYFIILNVTAISSVVLEFFLKSVYNIFTGKKMIRVRFFNSILYFYTIILAGISAIFYDNKDTLWNKEKR